MTSQINICGSLTETSKLLAGNNGLDLNSTSVQFGGVDMTRARDGSVSLEGVVFGPFGTAATVTEQFKIDLFNQTNMAPEAHSLTISNLPATDPQHPNLNLDYFIWTTETNSLNDARIQDNNPAFLYQPPSGWVSDLSNLNLPGYEVGTGHGTTQSGALNFMGDRVALYGLIGPSGGNYSVQVDNTSYMGFTTHRAHLGDESLENQMLFYADSPPFRKSHSRGFELCRRRWNPQQHADICREPAIAVVPGQRQRLSQDLSEEAALPIAESHVSNRGVATRSYPTLVPFSLMHTPPRKLKESRMMQGGATQSALIQVGQLDINAVPSPGRLLPVGGEC
ncbi:hypothetical protein C8J57DRAFT_1228123 [Mycena rebaudengoi]|nr:hypothetical protein C8J57DRAFT_1228123 [Mycena rebaudengoi]